MFTPADVHHGRATALHEARGLVLADAYAAHPERFVKGPPSAKPVPTKVWINEPKKGGAGSLNFVRWCLTELDRFRSEPPRQMCA